MPTKTAAQARAWASKLKADLAEGVEPTTNSARAFRAILTSEQPFNVHEMAEHLGMGVSGLYLVVGDMKRAGFPIDNPSGGVFVLTGEQQSEPYGGVAVAVVRGEGVRSKGKALATTKANGERASVSILRPPPEGLPVLGEVLRVSMLAESDDGEAMVLQGADGRRYFARLDSP